MDTNRNTSGALYAKFPGNKKARQKASHKAGSRQGQTTKNTKGDSKPKNKPYKCNLCGKMGHKASDCFKKNANKKQTASDFEEALMVCNTKYNCSQAETQGSEISQEVINNC